MAFAVMFGLGVLFMFIAFCLDAGLWYFDHRRAQNQAEAAAHAAVDALPAPISSASRQAAIDKADLFLEKNGSSPDERTCPVDSNDATNIPPNTVVDSFNPANRLNEVRVCVRRKSPAFFSQLAGIDHVWVSAQAMARVQMVPLQYALMVMDEGCSGGNGNLAVTGDGTKVNLIGDGGTYTAANGCTPAVKVSGNGAQLNASKNDTDAGDTCQPPNNPSQLNPPCTTIGSIPDPYADAQPLNQTGCNSFATTNGANNTPKRYCGKITITNGQTVFLDCSAVPRDQCFFTFTDDFKMNNGSTLLFKPSPKTGAPAIALDSKSSSATGSSTASSISWLHTVSNQSGRILLVGVVTGGNQTVVSVQYGSQTLTQVRTDSTGNNSSDVRTTLFVLPNPNIGTSTITVSTSGSTNIAAVAAGYYNVGGIGNSNGNNQKNTTNYAGTTVVSMAGQIVVDVVGMTSTTNSFSPGSGQSVLFTANGVDSNANSGDMSSKPGASSVSMTWSTSSPAVDWASSAVSLLPISDPGITLYFTCSTSPCNGSSAPNVSWSGNGMQLGSSVTPLRGNPDYNQMLIWVDQTASSGSISIAGGANVFLAGRIYAVKSDINLTGQGTERVDLNLNIIANQIGFSGGNEFNLTWLEEFAPVMRRVSITE